MLVAVVAASATSAVALLQAAPDLLAISLRLGLHASRRSRLLEPPSALPWAAHFAVLGGGGGGPTSLREALDALDAFHRSSAIAPHRHLYISASGQDTITISGPPSVLHRFLEQHGWLLSARPLPARAAYHAPHLQLPTPDAVDAILGTSPLLHLPVPTHSLSLPASSLAAVSRPCTVRQLLETAIVDILSLPVDLDAVARALDPLRPVPIGPLGQHILAPLAPSLRINHTPALASPSTSDDIAIVGLAGRFPGGHDLDSFWEVLSSGLDLHTEIPSTRFDLASHFDPTGSLKNSTSVPHGCFIDNPDLFDARLFNMSPREAAQTDPIARIFLMTVHEALEMSGYQYDRTRATDHRRIAVYFGQTSDDYREVNMGQNVDTFWVTGGNRMFANGRVNYHYGWEGPSMNVDGACSSSHMAIQLACSALLSRECDTAVAGGGMVITNPDVYAGLDRGGFLSHTGPCKPFDSQADGYCRAEAVGTLVLKRLEDAIADRDNIQAVIKGISTNHSADARSITHPHAETQEKLIRKVLRDAGVRPSDIGHVEMHGTGTQAGDLQETTSIASVFGDSRDAGNPLYIGALKANVGHSESASGVSAVIKSILMLQKSVIPRHIGIRTTLNPKLPALASMNIQIPMVNKPFLPCSGQDGRRRVMVNNFNAAGGNTCLLLEDVQCSQTSGNDPRTTHIVTISGRTSKSLVQNLQNMVRYIEQHGDTRLCDIAYTTTARRMHHSLRTAHVVSTARELVASLNNEVDMSGKLSSAKAPPIVFVFTGQGSLFAGMGHQLYASSSVFRQSIHSSDLICRQLGFPSFVNLIKEPSVAAHHYTTVQAQLGQAALELALAHAWISWGVKPTAVIGHSLGEYVALCLAEVLSVTDMFYVVGHRALLMQKNCRQGTHSMLAVAMNEHDARRAITGIGLDSCEVACLNGPTSTTIAGHMEELKLLHEELSSHNIKSTILDVPFANHSAQIQDIALEYELIAQQIQYGTPKIDVISTLLGMTIRKHGVFGAQYLIRQAREPVNFLGAVEHYHASAMANQESLWIEIGPRPTCLSMVRSIINPPKGRLIPSMRPTEDQWLTISLGLAGVYRSGVDVHWNYFHKEYENSLQLLDLPRYAFDLKSYWIQYEGDWNRSKSSTTQTTEVTQPPFTSTTLQRIESEAVNEGKRKVVFLSDLEEPNLKATMEGHLVDDWALCPSSVYADMAYTAAKYIWNQSRPGLEIPGLNVSNMRIHSPVVLRNEVHQHMRITATHDEATSLVHITYDLSSNDGHSAECSVLYENCEQWSLSWEEQAYFVRSVADRLTTQGMQNGTTERIFRKTAYRIFSRLVDYAPAYQGMSEVFLNGDNLEGYAKIKLQPKPSDTTFGINPYWIDSLGHLSGFVLNASSDRRQVYISEGFDSMRLSMPLSESTSYHTYVRMLPTGKSGWVSGNVYIMHDSRIVGVFQGVKFRAMKKKVLEMVMGSRSTKHTNVPPARTTITPQVQSSVYATPSAPVAMPDFASTEDTLAVVDSCICSETGVEKSDITDTTLLADIGIDSLLTMSLLATLQAQADLCISSADFMTFDTVGDLRRYVKKVTFTPAVTGSNTPSVPSPSPTHTITSADPQIALSTPLSGLRIRATATESQDTLQSIIVNELGLDSNDVGVDEYLEEYGLDSLMTMAVLHAFKDQTGTELPPSFFLQYPTLASAKQALAIAPSVNASELKCSHELITAQSHRATSVELQKACSKPGRSVCTLFLLPDGSGSASSYLNLRLPPNIRIIALNSPFLRDPNAFPSDLGSVASLFVKEILAQQPSGHYLLGGWSMGAAYAYEAANILVALGKQIEGIAMIDPCPLNRRSMTSQTLAVLEQVGVFQELKQMNEATQSIIRSHFEASTRLLAEYKPGARCADFPVLIISARSGVLQRLERGKAQELWHRYRQECGDEEAWLLLSRGTDKTHGWASMFKVITLAEMGGDHFSIMKHDEVQALNEILGDFCTKISVT